LYKKLIKNVENETEDEREKTSNKKKRKSIEKIKLSNKTKKANTVLANVLKSVIQ
jgi:hypothetical protein